MTLDAALALASLEPAAAIVAGAGRRCRQDFSLSTASLARIASTFYVDITQHTDDGSGRPRPTEAQLRDAALRGQIQERYGDIAAALRAHLLTLA